MEDIIEKYVETDYKDLLLKFDYNEINEKIYELESPNSSPKKIDKTDSNVSLPSLASITSLVSLDTSVNSYNSQIYYPDTKNIFRCFNYFNRSELKYVILGQDPYHNGQANGLAFSINDEEKQSASLRIINKEYNRSLNTDTILRDLTFLANKKTLLLNTALTVEKGKPGSHIKIWESFTKFIINEIDNENIIFFLWGNHAKKYKKYIKKSKIMESGHPSPLNRKNDFIGNNHFLLIQ